MLPVTILTGFLGSGKTTLLSRILKERHGHRIAVIQNEFGEAGIDSELLVQDGGEQIIEMNNGCLCCTVRGDLVRILGDLRAKRQTGQLAFERVVIETTGMADPGPVAQTFFVDEGIGNYYLLDSIVTLVDAKHAHKQLDDFREAQEQVGFADRILISKTDLIGAGEQDTLIERLVRINPRAPIKPVHFGSTPLDDIFDIRGFNLDAVLEIEPGFLEEPKHDHNDAVGSFVFRADRPLDGLKLEAFLAGMIRAYSPDLLRCKGVLWLAGNDNRVVFQGVHALMGGETGKPWGLEEKRASVMVFIGRNLPEDLCIQGLQQCLVS